MKLYFPNIEGMKLKAQKQNAKRGAAQRRESGFQVAKMTRATANQPIDSMLLLVAQSPPLKSKTYIMPPKPAKPQPMMVAMYLYLVTKISILQMIEILIGHAIQREKLGIGSTIIQV